MNDKSINEAVKQHYQQQTLSPETMARMVAAVDNKDKNKQKLEFWRRRWWVQRNLSIAASIFIAVLLIPLLWQNDEDLLADVAQEVALNHNKQMANEYVENSYGALARVMTKLDFELSFPARLQQTAYQVVGARYCSIQGKIAAQIKLVDEAGESITLYQTQLNDDLALLDGQHYIADKVAVQNWQEGGVFFSLASTAPKN